MPAKEKIVVISDMHTGSRSGLWPEEYITPKKDPIPASEFQLRLLERWDEFWKWKHVRQAKTVLFLGDLCQGGNYFDAGKHTNTPNMNHQIEAAAQLLKPKLKNKPKLFGVSGSKYHSSRDSDLDGQVMKEIGGVFLGMLHHIKVKSTGHTIQISHGDGPPYQYDGTMLSKEDQYLNEAIGRGVIDPIDVWVRGHYHRYRQLISANRVLYLNPGWQAWFGWGPMGKFYGAKKNEIGGSVIILEEGKKPEVKTKLFPPMDYEDLSVQI